MSFTPSNLHRDGMTAADHREAARADRQRAADSFRDCDTDGFLSQWAQGITAQEHELHAQLIEEGGLIETMAILDADTGEVASTHQGFGEWGEYWVLRTDAARKLGKRFWSPSNAAKAATRERNDRKRGFVFGTIKVRGVVGCGGGSITSVRACIVPDIDALRGDEFEVLGAMKVGEDRYSASFDK